MCKARLLLGLILSLLISACAEPLDPDDFNQVCRPADPACAEEDYDGDGVININDDFPADPRCSKRDNSSCSACGVGCAELERCDVEVGVCVARDPERCDGLDNDGDGNIDEGVDSSAPPATNQEGVCSGSVQRCVSGAWSEPALSDIEGYELAESACDGIDSDCDGSIDEALTPPSADNQAGVCAGSLKVCRGAEGWAEPAYSEREGFESDERSCDARDNDCDGLSDEESVVAQAPLAENQAGLCEGARQVCAGADGWVSPNLSSITGYEDAESTCDGVDSDCDGVIDEGLTAPLSDRQDGVCQGAQKVCQGTRGWVEPSYLDLVEGYEGAESACDGVDSDCDGVVDEGLSAPLALNQDGVCSGSRKVCRGELRWVEPEPTSVEGYELNETTCDGVDSDCDGSIDEGLTAPLATNQNGVCGSSRKLCAGAQGWRDPVLTSISGYESSESACDGVDSDCDGVIDEALSAPLATNQVGVCSGSRKVCGGNQGWRDPQLSSISGYEANETTCDGIDSDCDGSTDEGLTAPLSSNQAGVCEGAVMTCRGVQGWRDPLLTTINGYEGTESACDGVDSDCDGAVDEGLTGPVADRQEGVCAGSRKVCNGLGGWVEPDYQTRAGYEPVELGCDGVDSDCDGRVDELLNPPLARNQDGVCSGARKVCGGEAGWLNPNYAEVSARLEAEQSCDGVDEDCDGLVDEALTPPLATNQEGACVGALKVCTGAEGWAEPALSSSVGYEPAESACDGVDSDCDGVVDEGLTAPLSTLQDGVCAGQLKVCSGVNGWVEPAYAGVTGFEATEASCDGLDNDCDGVADEQLVGPLADRQDGVCAGARQSCGGVRGWVEPSYSAVAPGFEAEESVCDGVDSDCDGLVDERVFGVPADLQDGVCVGQVKVCQNAAFVEPDYSLILGYELTETSCNGVDSDCDGVVDEALTPPPSELQEGVCSGALQECFGGQFLEPDYSVIAGYEDNEQSCDALDNDCDGAVDEGLDFYQVSCGVGACRRLGLGQCVGGQYSESCTPGAPASTDGCDGVDNDCDGVLDEAGPPASNQVGVCAGSRQFCDLENSGSWIEPDYPSLPNAEADESLCDGLDNDCDGSVDEALVGALAPFALKQRGVCADVRRVCVSGQFIEPDYALQSPAFESVEVSCDGLDNDCDGRVDEGLTPPLADLQAGVCASQLKLCAGVDGWVEPEYELVPTYELSEQSCDLLDNDCDGSVDEAIAGVFAPLANRQLGVCQGSRKSCVNGGFAEPNYSLQRPQYERSELSCDGLDNDCDGSVDESLIPPLSDRQAGVCVNTLKSCGGVAGWLNPDYASLLPAFEAVERTCDGSDNDCDGLVDESSTLSTSPLAARQAGVCSGARRVCVDGAYVEPEYVDQKPQYELAELSCDGLDNDCDGVVDESLVGPLASRQDGVCEALRTVCAGAQGWLEPVYANVPGFEAVESECDGVDSDCDGSVDEDLSPPLAVQQAGVCAGQVQVCAGVNGWVEPDYALISSYELAESLCDGVDSDCDGAVDEALVLPPADLQAGACNGLLKAGCGGVAGWLEPDYASVVDGWLDEDVACDGVDNDCDGAVDEGGLDGTCGVGACLRMNEASCDNGVRVDSCIPGEPVPEICGDGVDNDCDGVVDEPVLEICGDGVDNGCDGETDEIEGEICGDGVDNDCDGVMDECEVTFTNCGQTGHTGPSQGQCDSSYSGTQLEGQVTVVSGIQQWTVPITGTYYLEVAGAQGGDSDQGAIGGYGGIVSGTKFLQSGQVLYILVGQEGYNSGNFTDNRGGGGGGGTFITTGLSGSINEIIAIASGGSAGSYSSNGYDGNHGRGHIYEDEIKATGRSSAGRAGGGYTLDGVVDCGDAPDAHTGRSFVNGGVGGVGDGTGQGSGAGGFGGGGGRTTGNNYGGGGGGYQGSSEYGDGDVYTSCGGIVRYSTSYISRLDNPNFMGGNGGRQGHGYVNILLVP